MNRRNDIDLAYDLLHEAYDYHMDGDYESAIEFYRRSIDACPTAEAHTFLGWTFSFRSESIRNLEIRTMILGPI
jgi:hypothetical protein